MRTCFGLSSEYIKGLPDGAWSLGGTEKGGHEGAKVLGTVIARISAGRDQGRLERAAAGSTMCGFGIGATGDCSLIS